MSKIPGRTDVPRLRRLFESVGIDSSRPGFYDDPAFKVLEAQTPTALEWYFPFVELAGQDAAYVERARGIIESAAVFLHERLVADGRKGACIDASLTLMRFLEEEGVWSLFVHGAARIRFPDDAGLETKYFWPIMPPGNPALTGHAWVFAPPFRVVDVSLDSQQYSAGEEEYLAGPVLVTDFTVPLFGIEDLAEPPMPTLLAAQGITTINGLNKSHPGLPQRIRRIGPVEIQLGLVSVAYIPCAVGASDGPLSESSNLILSGAKPMQLFEDYKRGMAS